MATRLTAVAMHQGKVTIMTRPRVSKAGKSPTTQPGYTNRNGQIVYDRLGNLERTNTNTSMCSDALIVVIDMERTGPTSSSVGVQIVSAVRVDCNTRRGCYEQVLTPSGGWGTAS